MIELKIEAKLKSGATITLTRDQVTEVEKFVATLVTGSSEKKKVRRYSKGRNYSYWSEAEMGYLKTMATELHNEVLPRGLLAARFRAFMKQYPGHTHSSVASQYNKIRKTIKTPSYIH